MVDGTDLSILNLKLILYCFEWLSGLKINFHKSEVFVFGVPQQQKEKMANMLNCKLECWPMTYLGIPISEGRLGRNTFTSLKNKMTKRLDPWKGKHLSSGGKLILTNSCLSSLPIYTMGFYLLPKGTHEEMDSIRGKFFWQGADEGNKYHMAKMDTICRPKDQGGLGILNTTRMNESLLVKWIWKIVQGSDDLWFKILQAKYMPNGNFFQSKTRGASQFWQGLHKVKHLFKWGAVYKVHNGEKISFWEDVWLGDVPLKIQFPTLFSFCEDHLVSVADSYDEGEWSIDLRRALTTEEAGQKASLLDLLNQVFIEETLPDEVEWVLDKSKQFSTKSFYRFLSHRGVSIPVSPDTWKTKLPLKIKVFLW
jgi:hypothetical protein